MCLLNPETPSHLYISVTIAQSTTPRCVHHPTMYVCIGVGVSAPIPRLVDFAPLERLKSTPHAHVELGWYMHVQYSERYQWTKAGKDSTYRTMGQKRVRGCECVVLANTSRPIANLSIDQPVDGEAKISSLQRRAAAHSVCHGHGNCDDGGRDVVPLSCFNIG